MPLLACDLAQQALPLRQVLLGRWKCALVAVKVLRQECTQHASSAALDDLRREAEMLQAMRHPCILTLYGVCLDCQPVCPVLDRSVADAGTGTSDAVWFQTGGC